MYACVFVLAPPQGERGEGEKRSPPSEQTKSTGVGGGEEEEEEEEEEGQKASFALQKNRILVAMPMLNGRSAHAEWCSFANAKR